MITIRRMREEDLPQVILLDQMSFSLPWPPSAYRHEMQNPGGRVWVAEMEAETPLRYFSPITNEELTVPAGEKAIVGVLVVWLIVDEAHIATVAVHSDVRRHGIGRKLLAISLADAARAGMVTSLLEVRAGNIAAQNLYLEFGYEVVGRRPHYYKDNGEDALLMTLEPLNIATLEGFLEEK